jgi:hypothetical protein
VGADDAASPRRLRLGVLETIGALAAGDAAELERLLALLEQRHADVLEALDAQHGQELRDLLDGD